MLDLESIVSQFIFQLRSIALGSGLLPGEAIVHLGPDAATSRADTHACLTKCLHAYMALIWMRLTAHLAIRATS
ncbi:hypothetical protein V2G26_011650 [Clonostachys chloroleuca]